MLRASNPALLLLACSASVVFGQQMVQDDLMRPATLT